MPNSPATIIFKIIEIDIISESVVSLNQNCTIAALMIANKIPLSTPIKNSFKRFCEKLSYIAKERL